jgi:hypothetical protein
MFSHAGGIDRRPRLNIFSRAVSAKLRGRKQTHTWDTPSLE